MGTFSFFCICLILFWMAVRRNQQIRIFITLTDTFSSHGFYLAHAYYIIHNGNLIMKWMNVTIHSKQMHIKWQSLSHCLLYDKEISTKLAFLWHSYISQFAKDSYPLVPTIKSYFYCTGCCCRDVLPWTTVVAVICTRTTRYHEAKLIISFLRLQCCISLSLSFSDKQWTDRRVHLLYKYVKLCCH